jgi:alkaline phosphatase
MASTTFSGPVTSTNGFVGAVTGDVTGGITGDIQALSGAGAVSLTTLITEVTTGAGAAALTLADGTAGQIKIITMVVDGGGAATLTPTTLANGSTLTFADAADTVMLVYNTTVGWTIVSNSGVVVA